MRQTSDERPAEERFETRGVASSDEANEGSESSSLETRAVEDHRVAITKNNSQLEGDGAITAHANSLEDELASARRDLVDAREASTKAIRAKTDFLSNMSHELRTPMNAILGMSEALWETNLSEEQRKILSVLINGGKSLLAIINDVLELSRIEGGHLVLEKEDFLLGDVVARSMDLLRPGAERKNLVFEIETSEVLSEFVNGDAKRIEQILNNVIGNALKFTERGAVKVRVERKSDIAKNFVLFSVEDTGIGIASEKLADLFGRFSQLDMSITKTYGGTGLGLAISKQLIELMGGTIWVESEVGKGTIFHFTLSLPVSRRHRPTVIPARSSHLPDSDFGGLRILVVEDSKDNSFLLSTFLKKTGAVLDFAENGKVAVEMFQATDYDLVLMDMQMPEMDGYAATRWLRILERRREKHTPIIALTAYAFAEEIQKSLDAGCDSHLSKPIAKDSLFKAISSFVG